MTGGELSSENVRNSDWKGDPFSLLSSDLGLGPGSKIRIILGPVPQRQPHRARASRYRGHRQCTLYDLRPSGIFLETQRPLTQNADGK